jgi:hypothetical protein
MTRLHRMKWLGPAILAGWGCVFLAAAWMSGDRREGIYVLVFMVALAVITFSLGSLLRGRSETIRSLHERGPDERFRMIDNRASAFAFYALGATLSALAVTKIAQGEDTDPYGQLLQLGIFSYVVAQVFLHWRR